MDRRTLSQQLELLRQRVPSLRGEREEDVFPVWVLLTLATSDEGAAAESICGGSYDQSIDAVLIDHDSRTVWIVQGKTHREPGQRFESAEAVRAFARLARPLAEGRRRSSDPTFWTNLDRNPRGASAKFEAASERFRRGYKARLVFASLWKFQQRTIDDARRIVQAISEDVTINLLGWPEVRELLTYYIHDIAPAVPQLALPIQYGELRPSRMGSNDMQAWTIAVRGGDLARLFDEAKERLFARNIRRYLGDKVRVNRAIMDTIRSAPERFWFLNNGITVACHKAEVQGDTLKMIGAQVINGQQTTRTLHTAWRRGGRLRRNVERCLVGVRVIDLGSSPIARVDQLIADIVEATNHQNTISQADLRSNDVQQIDLERALAARGYWYIRKRESSSERARHRLAYLRFRITKEKLAQAVGGALFESVPLREGQAPLFDPHQYYNRIFQGHSLEFMLTCWWLWRWTESHARGDTERQAAKFVVHYHMFQESRGWLVRQARRFIEASERRDDEVMDPLDRALNALFDGVLQSYRKNRVQDGHRYAVKPYFQSREVDAYRNFLRLWEAQPHGRYRLRFERAVTDLQGELMRR